MSELASEPVSEPGSQSLPVAAHPPWRKTYRRLLMAAGSNAGHLRFSLAGLIAAAVLQGLTLACLLPVLTAVLTERDAAAALSWLLVMAGLGSLTILARWRAQGFDYSGRLSAATHDLRIRLGETLRRMPLERLQDRRSGEVNATLMGNVDENFAFTLIVADLIFTAVLTPLTASLFVVLYDWRLGLLLLATFPIIVPLYRWRRPVHSKGRRALDALNKRLNADIVEFVQGLSALRAARRVGDRTRNLTTVFAELERLQANEQRFNAKPNVIIASTVELGLLVVAAIGLILVGQGDLDFAVLAAVVVMVSWFGEPLATFVNYTIVIEIIDAALDKIESLLSEEPLPQRFPACDHDGADIAFETVTFRYARSEEPVLRNFSARIPQRTITALVGASGSGKTTIARLLLRHADPQSGVVRIGGADLRTLPPEDLNGLVSVVFQDVYLFDDTVIANIRMGRPGASDAEVEAAARSACCLDFIERLPQGWQTRIGDIGGCLSGGEAQRISIARALLKDAPIVVLDEPTAALDAESERAVQAAIDTLVQDKTVVVIAHRLSTIVGADTILVLENGRVAESGQHAELLAEGGRYAEMWREEEQIKRWGTER